MNIKNFSSIMLSISVCTSSLIMADPKPHGFNNPNTPNNHKKNRELLLPRNENAAPPSRISEVMLCLTGTVAGAGVFGSLVNQVGGSDKSTALGALVGAVLVGYIGKRLGFSADENYKNFYNHPAIQGKNVHYTAAMNNVKGTDMWLDRSHCSIEKDGESRTPIMYAAHNGADGTFYILLDRMPKVIKTERQVEDKKVTKKEITATKIDPDGDREEPVKVEIVTKDTETKTVVEVRETLNDKDLAGKTIAQHAYEGGHYHMIKALLDAGANGAIKDNSGCSIENTRRHDPELEMALNPALAAKKLRGSGAAAAA